MATNNQDILNGEISLGSKLSDLLAVTQGLWADTTKNGWNLIKLDSGKGYMLPQKFNAELTPIIYVGDGEIKGGLIKLGDEAITAPLSGVAIIIIK